MASKKDLIEAQSFSRNRLLSAFTGGAPGGKELEPAKPMRAVFGGVALTAMVILAGVFVGLLKPGLPGGWENNRLIVARDTGARYLSVNAELHPVINTVSARMLIPAGEFKVVSVDQSSLSGIPIGGTIGILGGPDTLPKAADLDGTHWQACAAPETTEFWIGEQRRTAAPDGAGTVVVRDGETFVVSDGTSFAVPEGSETAVLRAVGLDTVQPHEVRGDWLALFATGTDLAPLTITGGTGEVAGVDLPAGTVIHPTGSPELERYLLTASGELAPLDPLAHRLYMLGDGADGLGVPVELTPSEIADLPTTEPAGGTDWPTDTLSPLAATGSPCATLAGSKKDQRTVLAAQTFTGQASVDPAAAETGVNVHLPDNVGALVRGGPKGTLTLIDSTGTSYAIPGAVGTGVKRLGYTGGDVAVVPARWLHLLPAGPELTPEAAGTSPTAAK
ncbi:MULTISPECIES: type VII secretion protein EccB [unclassified Leucobacter]|uniref:type VII secretion protein EccB n=1 Tax=unclassified Leucobacter TaxID=2621730 RepID=UPI00165E920F|nr:type VII secretion protein EccB [Leucobacter sp. cx-87]